MSKLKKNKGIQIELSNTAYILVIGLLTVFCIISITLAFTTKDITSVYFDEYITVDDTVSLKENNFYESDVLVNQKKYIAGLIQAIKLDYRYKLDLSKLNDYDCTYSIATVLKIYEFDHPDNIYWSQEKIVLDETKADMTNDFLVITESVDINYDEYNQIVKDFSKNYSLLLSSTLDVELRINFDNKIESYEGNLDRDKVVRVSIPMNEQSISINKNTSSTDNVLINTTTSFNVISGLYLIVGVILLIFDILFIRLFVIRIKKDLASKSEYQKKLDYILKNYDQIIMTSKNMPDIGNLKLIEAFSFDELLDAQEELRIPIAFYEYPEKDECVFVIMNGENAWIYRLKDDRFVII